MSVGQGSLNTTDNPGVRYAEATTASSASP